MDASVLDSLPSLKKISANAVALSLWRSKEIKNRRIQLSEYNGCGSQRNYFTEMLCVHINSMRMPEQLKFDVEFAIYQMEGHILLFRHAVYSGQIRSLLNRLPESLESRVALSGLFVSDICWTMHGTVNSKKTIRGILRKESIWIGTRLLLACVFCCENEIYHLIQSFSRKDRFEFFNYNSVHYVVEYWAAVLNIAFFKPDTTDTIKKILLDNDYREVFDYFINKLSPEQKSEIIDAQLSTNTFILKSVNWESLEAILKKHKNGKQVLDSIYMRYDVLHNIFIQVMKLVLQTNSIGYDDLKIYFISIFTFFVHQRPGSVVYGVVVRELLELEEFKNLLDTELKDLNPIIDNWMK